MSWPNQLPNVAFLVVERQRGEGIGQHIRTPGVQVVNDQTTLTTVESWLVEDRQAQKKRKAWQDVSIFNLVACFGLVWLT